VESTECSSANSKMLDRALSAENALAEAVLKNEEHEFQIRFLRKQRNIFMDREVDTAVAVDVINSKSMREIRELQVKLETAEANPKSREALAFQVGSEVINLRKTVELGESKLKTAASDFAKQLRISEIFEENLLQTRVEMEAALMWYVNITADAGFSVPKKFAEVGGHEIEAMDIMHAHERYELLQAHVQKNCKENLIEFLINPNAFTG